jgi:hypothetical protein
MNDSTKILFVWHMLLIAERLCQIILEANRRKQYNQTADEQRNETRNRL